MIVVLTSLASGAVLALQGYTAMVRFGAKEYIAHLVGLSLVRELGPVFTALIFSGKAGARITAELGTMSVNDQVLATRALGVDPVEFLVVPRMVACFLVLPILTIIGEIVGIPAAILSPLWRQASRDVLHQPDDQGDPVRRFWGGFPKVFFCQHYRMDLLLPRVFDQRRFTGCRAVYHQSRCVFLYFCYPV